MQVDELLHLLHGGGCQLLQVRDQGLSVIMPSISLVIEGEGDGHGEDRRGGKQVEEGEEPGEMEAKGEEEEMEGERGRGMGKEDESDGGGKEGEGREETIHS